MVIAISHPTGSAFVRNAVLALYDANLLDSFHTTLAFQSSDLLIKLCPEPLAKLLLRRSYALPEDKLIRHPLREALRLLALRAGLTAFTRHETGFASVDAVYRSLDRATAAYVNGKAGKALLGVYCYEDGALATFKAAGDLGLRRLYDLPIPYFETLQTLLKEEAARHPQWVPTMSGVNDSSAKLERKAQELELADVVILNSTFTKNSLPASILKKKPCVVVEYGAPELNIEPAEEASRNGKKLRVLFAGTLTQRKGLADVFAAMQLLKRQDVELVVMGATLAPMEFYRRQFADFVYEPPRAHSDVLRLMQSCDAFVFPSIAEGRGLVQLEALACGLPLITTVNATGDDLIDEGKTGFLIPIRSPEAIAERINWFADNRQALTEMRQACRLKVKQWSWQKYRRQLAELVSGQIAGTRQ